MRKLNKISIVIPVYYNEDNLKPLYEDLVNKVFQNIECDYELIFVDDGSKDKSFNVIQELAQNDNKVKVYGLSRNFGSHAAILCGLCKCTGECAVVKAADLQEPSEMILEMIREWENENNVVLAVRSGREEGLSQTLFANFYYSLVRKFALPNMPKNGFDTYLIDRKVIEVLRNLDEKNSALTGQILWSGFRTSQVHYIRQARTIGKSRWTLKKKIRLVMDTLFSFSLVPIDIVTGIGVCSFLGALIWGFIVLINKLIGNIAVSGWTTLFIFNLMSFGVTMLTLGLLGNYLWRTFDASRNRPTYIIEREYSYKVTNEK